MISSHRLQVPFLGFLAALLLFHLYPGSAVGGTGFRESGAKFLTVGGGGRALAMAETYVVETTDPFVVFYNPAALTSGQPTRVGLAHKSHFQNAHGEYAALSLPAGRLVVGVGMQFFAVNDIPRRELPTAEPLIEFDASDVLFLGSVGYDVSEKVRVGLSAKGVFQKIDTEVANGVALDLGGTYRVFERLTVGTALNHLGPEMSYDKQSYKLPSIFRLGAAYAASAWTARTEIVSPNNESAKLHLGGEYVFNVPLEGAPPALGQPHFSARGGYAFGYDTRTWALGFGIGANRVEIDYAFVPYDDDLGNTHHFGLVLTLQ